MRSRVLALISTAVLAGGGILVTSCGSDDEKRDGEAQVDVGQMAKATAAKGTARMVMRMRMSGLGLPDPVVIGARGVTALGEPRGRLSMDMGPLLKLVGAPVRGDRDLDLILDGADLYARPPRIGNLNIPGDKPWIALDLERLAEAAGLPTDGLGALFSFDPASQLRALKAAKRLKEVGKEEIDGVQTTHLKGSYRLSDVIAGLPAEERADAREALDSLERIGGQETGVNNPTPAELWVDGDGVTRRMRATSKLPAQAGTPAGSLAITYALRDFGAKLDTSGPPASERYDATDDLEAALKSFSDTR